MERRFPKGSGLLSWDVKRTRIAQSSIWTVLKSTVVISGVDQSIGVRVYVYKMYRSPFALEDTTESKKDRHSSRSRSRSRHHHNHSHSHRHHSHSDRHHSYVCYGNGNCTHFVLTELTTGISYDLP